MKKWLIILGALAALSIIIIVLLLRQTSTTQTKSSVPTGVTGSSSSATLPSAMAFATLHGSTIDYLDLNSGNFATHDLATDQQQEHSQFLLDPIAVLWSPDGSKVLNIASDDGSTSVITTANGLIQPLDDRVFTPSWSADSKQILYQFVDRVSGKSTITVANADGSNWQNIVAAPNVFIGLWWSPLGTYAIGIDGANSDYYLIAISSKKVTKLATGASVSSLKWSPSGELALLDSSDSQSLTIADVTDGNVITLDIPGIVRKFTWQDETHLVGMSDGKFVSVDLGTKQSKVVGDASQLYEFAQVLGIYKDTIIYTQDGAISSVALSQ